MKKALIFNNNTTTPQKSGCSCCFRWFLTTFFTLCFLLSFSPSHAFSINPDAIVRGGAIQAVNMDMTMRGQSEYEPLVISHNTAQYEGGAVYVYSRGGSVTYDKPIYNATDIPIYGTIEITEEREVLKEVPITEERQVEKEVLKEMQVLYDALYDDIRAELKAANPGWGNNKLKNQTNKRIQDLSHQELGDMYEARGLGSSTEIGMVTETYIRYEEQWVTETVVRYEEGIIGYQKIVVSSEEVTVDIEGVDINILDNVTISHNSLNGPDRAGLWDYYYGGAIFFNKYNNANTTMNINFTGNNINIENNEITTPVIASSSSNRGYIHGGAVYISVNAVNFNGTINITGNKAEFATGSTGNYLYVKGGAMYFGNLDEVNFNDGSTITATGNTASSGGAMYFGNLDEVNFNEGSTLTVTGNEAYDGGVMYFYAGYSSSSSFTMTVNFNSIITATGNRGPVMSFYDIDEVNFNKDSNITITRNAAKYDGGAMYFRVHNSTMTVNFNEGSKITATGNKASLGNAIYFTARYRTMTVNFNEGSVITVTGYKAEMYGGAMSFNSYTSSAMMVNFNGEITVTGNKAKMYGGAMSFYAYDSSPMTVKFNEGSIINATDNEAEYRGGAMYFEGHGSTIEVNFNDGSTITATGNTASSGGAMNFYGGTVNFNAGSTIIANDNLANRGGAMCFEALYSTMTVNFNSSDLVFDGNTSGASSGNIGGRGGAMYFYSYFSTMTVNFNGTINITRNKVEFVKGSNSYPKGGAMKFMSHFSTMTVNFNSSDLIFDGNTGANDGSAIYLHALVARSSATRPSSNPAYSYLDVIFHKAPTFENQIDYPIYVEVDIDHSDLNYTQEDMAYVRIYNPPVVAGYVQAWKSGYNALNAWAVVQKYDSLPTIDGDGKITPVDDSLAWQVIHDGRSYYPDKENYDTTASWDSSGVLNCINYTDGRCE